MNSCSFDCAHHSINFTLSEIHSHYHSICHDTLHCIDYVHPNFNHWQNVKDALDHIINIHLKTLMRYLVKFLSFDLFPFWNQDWFKHHALEFELLSFLCFNCLDDSDAPKIICCYFKIPWTPVFTTPCHMPLCCILCHHHLSKVYSQTNSKF